MEVAETVAYVYFGRMIDVLSFEKDIPIQIYIHGEEPIIHNSFARRMLVSQSDFSKAFSLARLLEEQNTIILRAIGWYAKGKVSKNSFDQFLSYWNVIEILGTIFYTETPKT